ncbi:hypothetical protein HanXRQr2_Chr05g0229351 [Helianthus annuus]|uniref:Uncharacterized protein n=1 Tax=Helianthus annuus TaxID=4232 RepID=A0A9K3NPE8_HELAN|nr:hypothetical protein HanXRQr2_Chr05g0229351 [Helianthus annuus]
MKLSNGRLMDKPNSTEYKSSSMEMQYIYIINLEDDGGDMVLLLH